MTGATVLNKPALDKKERKPGFSVLGWMLGLMVVILYGVLVFSELSGLIIAILAVGMIFIREKYQSNGLGLGVFFILIGTHGIFWYFTSHYVFRESSSLSQLARGLPILVISFFSVYRAYWKDWDRYIRWPGIYLFVIQLTIMLFWLLDPISPALPAMSWLALSVLLLGLAHFIRNKQGDSVRKKGEMDRFLLHGGYLLVLLFILWHVMISFHNHGGQQLFAQVYLPAGLDLSLITLVDVYAIVIFSLWLIPNPPQTGRIYLSWRLLRPLYLELILLTLFYIMTIELPLLWHPVAWILIAIICLLLGNRSVRKTQSLTSEDNDSQLTGQSPTEREDLSRLRFYSLLFSLLTAFYISLLLGKVSSVTSAWWETSWVIGFIVVLLQFLYLALFYLSRDIKGLYFPKPMMLFKFWLWSVERVPSVWAFYPLIISVAMFLFWSFEKSVLTLVWVVECFVIFVLSIILRESHFRYAALGGLGLCVARLVFYDLRQAETISKALVFLGAGIIMLAMNYIYNKYKARFS